MRTTTPITALSATFQHGLTRISRTQPRPERPDMIMKRVELSIGVRVRVSGHGRLSRVDRLGPYPRPQSAGAGSGSPVLGGSKARTKLLGKPPGALRPTPRP